MKKLYYKNIFLFIEFKLRDDYAYFTSINISRYEIELPDQLCH